MRTKSVPNPSSNGHPGGFSLVEVLISLAGLSSLAALALFGYANLLTNSGEQKLRADVAALNSAVNVYMANGGKIASSWKADKILLELKTIATADSGAKLAGLRGALLDSRIDIELETYAEAAEGNAKALWDGSNQRFYIAYTSQRGIKKFVTDEALSEAPVGERVRETHLDLAVVDDWIWDYEDHESTSQPVPNIMEFPAGGGGEAAGGGEDPLTLNVPAFSIAGGEHPLAAYDLAVYLTNPNPAGVSEIQYSVTPGVWQTYGGEAITVSAGDSIEAYVASIDTANWSDSEHALEIYTTIPIAMFIGFNFPKHAFTYMEMGGAMIPGIYPPEVIASGTVGLLNGNEIPPQYLDSSMLSINEIADGSELPVTLDAALQGPIVISLASYGTESEATFQAVARNTEEAILDSQVVSHSVGISPMTLREPRVREILPPSGPPVAGVRWVEMELRDTELGDTPEGARIYYTTDGSDPGDDNGMPASPNAQLYEGAFALSQPASIPIKARVYGPTGSEHWFVVSEASEITWPPGLVITFEMDVRVTSL